jgi:uncharacterized protein YbjT (DUF2867 family)
VILVTGAAGKTGRAVVRALVARGAVVRALAYRPAQIQPLRELGAGEVVVGDARDRATVDRATMGVRSLYHICPNISPDEFIIGGNVLDAACSAGLSHVVYHSVLHPQTESMPHHWGKLRVEEQLFESGLPYTILQPAAYMQNILAGWRLILEDGLYRVPYALDTRLGMVDLEDVAAVAAIVLTEPGHQGAIYELAGAEALTPTDVAAHLADSLGRTVRAEALPLDVWEEGARQAGLGDYQVKALIKMFRYYESYGFWGNPNVLGWLLGRPPTRFTAFLARTVRESSTSPEVRQ